MQIEPYPKSAPRACRRDAWPDDGSPPGSNLDLIRSQYLDAYGVEYGMLGPLGMSGQSEINVAFSAAMTSAVNDWQRDFFARPEPRLKAGIVVPYEDAEASVREIERCVDDPHTHSLHADADGRPAGNRRYWPIYAAAERHALLWRYVFGSSGHPLRALAGPLRRGKLRHSTSCQTVVTSLVIEGVSERFRA